MQWLATELDECTGTNQLIIVQKQGDNTPTVITFTGINLTGMDFVGTVSFPVPISLAIGSGLEITDAVNGELTLQLDVDQTQTVATGQYPFEIWSIGTEATPVQTDPVSGFWVINAATTVIS